MKSRDNRAITLATAASLGLSLGIGVSSAFAEQGNLTGTTNTNKLVSPQKQGNQIKLSNQHKKASGQIKIGSNQAKTSNQIKGESQSKTSNQHKIGFKVEEKEDSTKK